MNHVDMEGVGCQTQYIFYNKMVRITTWTEYRIFGNINPLSLCRHLCRPAIKDCAFPPNLSTWFVHGPYGGRVWEECQKSKRIDSHHIRFLTIHHILPRRRRPGRNGIQYWLGEPFWSTTAPHGNVCQFSKSLLPLSSSPRSLESIELNFIKIH